MHNTADRLSAGSPRRSHFRAPPSTLLSTVLLVFVAANASAGNIATDSAAKLIHGTNASIRYQLYQSSGTVAPQKVDAFMAPVLGAIKNGITTGLDPFTLGILKDQALSYATTTASRMTPEQAMNAGFSFLGDAVPLLIGGPGTAAAKIAISKLGLDFIKMNLTAYMNPAASGQGLSRGTVVFAVQPPNVQISINNYYMTVMAEAYDTGASNNYFAQSFDQIFKNDFGASIKDNATTVLNSNLNLPSYFRTHANSDGSLSVDIAGLKAVYGDQSQALTQSSTQALNLAQFVDQAQRQSFLSGASLNAILQSVPADVQQQVQAQYLANQKTIATASAGINLASNLAGFFNQKTAQEISVYGNAAVQFATAANAFSVGTLTAAGAIGAVVPVVGAALAVYTLIQSNKGPSQDAVIQQQLTLLGQKIDQFRAQMNVRFDIIDSSLNTILQTINTNFNVIIPNLALIIQQLSTLQADLNRFERNFYDLEISGFLSNLDAAVTGCIAFRQLTGHNLTFSQYSGPTGCENIFYLWGTQNSITLANIPGNRAYDDNGLYKQLTQPVSNPDLNFFVDSANINYLSQYPFQRFGIDPLSRTPLPNPSVWELSAQSYLQLARENPAYEATQASSKLADIISTGTAVQQALKQVTASDGHGSHPLFNNLISNYSAKASTMGSVIANVESNFNYARMQNITNSKLASHPTIDACGGQAHGLATPSSAFNVLGTFLLADNLSSSGRPGFGQVTACIDLGFQNVSNGRGDLAIYLNRYYKGTKISSVYIEGNKGVAANQSQLDFFWRILPDTRNYPSVKAAFEGRDPTTPVRDAYPCVRNGDVVRCQYEPEYGPLLSTATKNVNQDAAYQKDLYCNILGDFASSTPDGVAVQTAATQLAGTKAALEKYLLIGTPHSLRSNDYLRALVYGKLALLGRAENGQDDVVTYVYGPAVMALTGAPNVTQACGTGVTTTETSPKLDLSAILSPRIANIQSALTDMLGRIDQNQISEYDDTLNSTLQSLQTFLDAKIANTVATTVGSNVTVKSPQDIQVTFPTVLQPGVTVTTLTEPGAASGVPGGFVINGTALTTVLAYNVETTSVYVGPVTTCFTVNSINNASAFAGLAVLHSEASGFMDRTVSRDFLSRTICAKTDSLSPFVIAIKVAATAAMPQVVVSKTLTRNTTTNEVVVELKIANTAGGMAQNVQLTVARINTTAGTPLPQVLGGLAVSGSANATVRFPGTIGGAGVAAILTIGGTYAGGSFNTAARVTLP